MRDEDLSKRRACWEGLRDPFTHNAGECAAEPADKDPSQELGIVDVVALPSAKIRYESACRPAH
jgi:hypothetical protein